MAVAVAVAVVARRSAGNVRSIAVFQDGVRFPGRSGLREVCQEQNRLSLDDSEE